MYRQHLAKIYNHLLESNLYVLDTTDNNFNDTTVQILLWNAPSCFSKLDEIPEGYPFEEEIVLLNDIFQKMGYAPLEKETEEALIRGEYFNFMSIYFWAKHPKYRSKPITIFAFIDDEEQFPFLISEHPPFDSYNSTFRHLEEFYFEEDSPHRQGYFQRLQEVLEQVCDEIDGLSPPPKTFNEPALAEFIALVDFDNSLSEEDISQLKDNYRTVLENPIEFAQKMVDEGMWEDDVFDDIEEMDRQYMNFYAFQELLYLYHDDWKFDAEALSEFISELIDKPFTIKKKECGNDSDIVRDKLERESDFTLLDLVSGSDDCHFMVVRKVDKDRIISLASELEIWVQ